MIRFESVTFRRPNGVVALRDVDLEIEKGELVAIVGPNGAGKTTLLKHMNGLLKPTYGRVLVDGEDTRKASVASLSRKVGLVFQNPDHQLFSETVEAEITFGLKNFGFPEDEIRKRVEDMLDFFGLKALRKRAPLTLSGGEKKRLCIATVLAWDPEVLVLDEPTVGQDYLNKLKLYEVIEGLRRKGKGVIIVSHDIEFLWPLQPRTIVLSEGRVLRDGPAEEVYLDSRLLKRARVRQPQLAELSAKLALRRPPRNVHEAVRLISEVI